MIELFDWQYKYFVNTEAKYNIVPAGRRSGKTQGAVIASIIATAEGKHNLWVDTMYSNITKYFERYFIPFLKENKIEYDWHKSDKTLKIGSGFIDFRSADRPENIEGFGYHNIYLNEAGIILNDDYLYSNAILPMLMDFEDSKLFAFGTPKGKVNKHGEEHKFFTLWKKVEEGAKNYRGKTFSTKTNPKLSLVNINDVIEELEKEGLVLDQEIYGLFVDSPEGVLFKNSDLKRFALSDIGEADAVISYIDVAHGGGDYTCMPTTKIIGDKVYLVDVVMSKANSNFTIPTCSGKINEFKVNHCVIETNGGGKTFFNNVVGLSRENGGARSTRFYPLFNSVNKETRVIANAYSIKKNFMFRNDYEKGSDYDKFVKQILSFNMNKKLNKGNDDAPDALSGLSRHIDKHFHYLFNKSDKKESTES